MFVHQKKGSRFSLFISICLIVLLLFPASVFAEGEEPPAAEEEVAVESTEAAEEPSGAEEAPVEEAAEETTEETAEEEVVEEKAAAEAEELAEIVEDLSEAEIVIVDEAGEAVPMASQEAAEALAVPDPWVVRGGVTHRFLSDCTGQPIDANNTCTVTSTPVQNAIDFAVAGETVFLGPGIFTEQISIDKDLTLQGETGTVINSPSTLNVSFTTSKDNKAIVYVNNANVTIDNILVDGLKKGNANYRFMGIAYYNAGGTISNSEVKNIIDDPFSGVQHGVGIYIYNDDGVARTVDILDNIVYNYQKTGIAVAGDDLTANIDGNKVTGKGNTGTTAQNGIQLSYGATGSVTNNEVKGNYYTGGGWAASNILLYQATGTVNVEGNTLINGNFGVAVIDTVAEVKNNDIQEHDYGIPIMSYYVPQTANAFITGNTIKKNTLGVYTDNPDTSAHDNLFIENDDGYWYDDWWELGGTSDAEYNYWNCDGGPGAIGCDTVIGSVDYDPWLIDPDKDWVFVATDGSPDYVDNCPDDYNPGQKDSDGDGIGDVCDPIPYPPAPVQILAGADPLIPVTGGELVELSCEVANTLFLPDGRMVVFNLVLCGFEASLDDVPGDSLPGELPDGSTFASGLSVNVLEDGSPVETIDGTMSVMFPVPEGMEDAEFGIMYWDAEASAWEEISAVTVAGGFVTATVDFPGTFILVTK
jgi:hypothetical protein